MRKLLVALVLMLGVLVGGATAHAQSATVVDVVVEGDGVVEVTAVETEVEAGAEAEVNGSLTDAKLGSWGLFWVSVREQWTLLTTRSPEEKAELRVKFAEARLEFAEQFSAKADDEKTEKRAEHMIERATTHLNRVAEQHERWFTAKDKRAEQTLERAAAQVERRGKMLEDMEIKKPERAPKLEDVRKQGEAGKERLMKAIEKEQVPNEVRVKLDQIKKRIEARDAAVRETQEERLKIIERMKAGDTDATKELRALHQKRSKQQEKREVNVR